MSLLRRERAAIAERSARASSTMRAYTTDWASFEAWCESCGRPALPASSDSVQLYLIGLGRLGRLPATMERRVCAITWKHRAAGLASPVDAGVRSVLLDLRRQIGAAPKWAKDALSVADLRAMLRTCGRDGVGLRDRALLLVGFASGLRRSELAALRLADVRIEKRGAVLRLERSKTDQSGEGRAVGIHYGKRGSCPIAALQAWMKARGRWPGPLFCGSPGAIHPGPMSGESINEVVKAHAAAAGLDASRIGAHSLRAGLVTAAGAAGVGVLAIAARTGHRDLKTLQRYMRPGTALAVDPLAGLL